MSENNQNLTGWQKFIKRITKAKDIEHEDEIMTDHNYDGIRELDNVLPPWWVWGFYITIAISVFYYIMVFMGNYNQEKEYQEEIAQAKIEHEAWLKEDMKNHPEKYTEAKAYTDKASLDKGKELFMSKGCIACHGVDGGGGIGPNFTDNVTILGCDFKSIFNTISKGGRPGKGMVAWENSISKEDRQLLASYILSLKGTSPANPKDPEGDIKCD
jgi:cytochrome c oxidase cbb3-type subunit 3